MYTTVNVQHLESLNDKVRDITGVQVRETLPDWVLQEAFELVLIDLPPRELLERLREGKVYVPEQARAAIDAFFSQTNLTALRELAMQTAAARWMPTWPTAIANAAGKPRPCEGACWWAWMATTVQSAWCVMPAVWPSAATCLGAWCMWTTAACATKLRASACKLPSNWPNAWAGRWCCCAPAKWYAR